MHHPGYSVRIKYWGPDSEQTTIQLPMLKDVRYKTLENDSESHLTDLTSHFGLVVPAFGIYTQRNNYCRELQENSWSYWVENTKTMW
jgi:hypothetical protein